jgi:hypothetical protein
MLVPNHGTEAAAIRHRRYNRKGCTSMLSNGKPFRPVPFIGLSKMIDVELHDKPVSIGFLHARQESEVSCCGSTPVLNP